MARRSGCVGLPTKGRGEKVARSRPEGSAQVTEKKVRGVDRKFECRKGCGQKFMSTQTRDVHELRAKKHGGEGGAPTKSPASATPVASSRSSEKKPNDAPVSNKGKSWGWM